MALQQHVMSWFMHTLNEMPSIRQDYDHWLQDGSVLTRSKRKNPICPIKGIVQTCSYHGCMHYDYVGLIYLVFFAFAVMHTCSFNSVPMEHVSPELQVRCDVQRSAKEWSLGCVIPASWPPLAALGRISRNLGTVL